MEFVKRKAMQFKAKSGLKPEQPTYSLAAPTSSEPLKNVMVGFDEVVARLLEKLTGEPSNQRSVIPIVGMGGLGKTSLAKTVFEHSSLEDHFDVHLWATISQQYSAQNILTELVYGRRKSPTSGNVSELGEQLHKRLYRRRYLVVLDDMWNEGAWDEVQLFLPDNGNGSRVVVTTRLSNLATHLSSSPFKLSFLDKDKSWELFCGKTFGEEDCPIELKGIGKKIVQRCRGLPLSIVVIGGHLRKSSRAIEYWEKVANYMNPISSIGEEKLCLEILSLSYEHLPAYLKSCFLHLGIFMEDQMISALELIQYWIGEGFLRPKIGLSLEEIGEDCLNDLIDRNLIYVESRRWNGNVTYFKIHDTVRELCLKVCKKEKFMCMVGDSTQVIGCMERRIVIPGGKKHNSDMIGAKQSAPRVRSLVNQGRDTSFLNELLPDCNLLRVLAHDCSLLRVLAHNIHTRKEMDDTCLPLAHIQLVNLRIFDKRSPHTAESAYSVLSSISSCWNLQTLHMMSFDEPITLPYEIWEMPHLRQLQVHQIYLPDPVLNDGSTREECIVLKNLCRLEGVLNLRLTEEVCKRMPNLKELFVSYDHSYDDYCLHNLCRFNKLKRLRIKFDEDFRWYDDVPSLTLPTSLEELDLCNFHLGWTMMISSLHQLGFLGLESVSGSSEWNLDEEEFSCLKGIQINGCADLIYLNANSSHFPVLEHLLLINMPKLSEIPLDIGEIPTLRIIDLVCCSVSAAVSAVRIVTEQKTNGNYDLQLHVSFWQGNGEEIERFQKMLQEECLTTNSLRIYNGEPKMRLYIVSNGEALQS